jgi:hypothetical protein
MVVDADAALRLDVVLELSQKSDALLALLKKVR